MSRELEGMIYQWVGNKELRYIKLGRELGAMIYQLGRKLGATIYLIG